MKYSDYIREALRDYDRQTKFVQSEASLHAYQILTEILKKNDENLLRAYVEHYMGNLESQSSERLSIEKTAGAALKKNGRLYGCLSSALEKYHLSIKKTSITDKEKTAALNRYALGSFFSLRAKEHHELPSEIKNVNGRVLDKKFIENAVKLLEAARLTINFRADIFFEKLSKSKSMDSIYKNIFEQQSPTDSGKQRLRYEEKFFQYEKILNSLVADEKKEIQKPDARIFQAHSPLFDPSVRPKYGALDFLFGQHGGAVGWGKSFFELKGHVKQRCTFAAGDTGFVNTRELATIFDYQNILKNASSGLLKWFDHGIAKMLENDFKADETDKYQPPEDYAKVLTHYIEAHIHAEIDFLRDVKCIHLDQGELNHAKIDNDDLQLFIQNMQKFGVEVRLIGQSDHRPKMQQR